MNIVALGPGDEAKVRDASPLFDGPARDDASSRFLNDPNHHLLVAYEGDVPAGFVSGVEVTQPDKGTEMFLYELAVDARFRRRGIGRVLVAALADLARGRGCYGMFVLTDDGNPAALATYQAAGGVPDAAADRLVMLTWDALT